MYFETVSKLQRDSKLEENKIKMIDFVTLAIAVLSLALQFKEYKEKKESK